MSIKPLHHAVILHGTDNNPFCPLDQAQYLHSCTGSKFVLLPSQEHFSVSTMGETYRKFPRLLELLQSYK